MASLSDETAAPSVAEVLAGGGEMGTLMRALDWAATPLGPVESWSPSLCTMVKVLLANRFPLLLWWGPEQCQLYNDAYRPVLGAKHPRSLGQPARECFPEIWHIIGPLIETPYTGGPSTWDDDLFLEVYRHGFVEETHFTVAYSPVPDDSAPGGIGGVLATVHEITQQIIQERRLAVLRDLGARSADAKTAEEACVIAAAALAHHPKDVPFALLYLLDADQRTARLAAAASVPAGTIPIPGPAVVDLAAEGQHDAVWPLAAVLRTEQPRVVAPLHERLGTVPPGPWSDPPEQALVLPLPSSTPHRPAGLLVHGLSARLALDDPYRSFCVLVAGQIGTAITNARAYEEERKRAEALAELDRAKTAFFSNVSHEFRTPLTLLLGPLEEALAAPPETPLGAERAQLESAHRNSLRLLRLVNTLLDFSRIEAGRAEASYEPIDLAAYTAEMAGVFRSAVERAGLRLVVECPPLPEPVYVDQEMWEKIVLNLLSNAFKFTLEGEIAVCLRPVGGRVELEVRDTGTGIPAQELPHLFERFHRVRGARARTHEGTGIGLALVRELVVLHGGTIGVESTPGVGTTFTAALPLGAAHLPPERIGAARALASTALGAAPYVEEALRWLPDADPVAAVAPERPADEAAPPGATAPAEAAAAARILLADDNADMRGYLRRLLGERYTVEAVTNGAEALAAAQARPPDLVLADVMMPGLDGFGLLQALRADPRTHTLPVILLSARAGQEAIAAGLQAGADDYLVKPFAASELLARVQAHLALAWLRQEARAEAEAERQHLHDLFMQAPAIIAVLRGPEHVFEVANPLYLQIVGRHDPGELLGRRVREAIPEGDGQGYFELLDQVYATGTPFVGTEMAVMLDRRGDGILEEVLVNLVLQPYRNAEGVVEGIMAHAIEVTEQVWVRRRGEELAQQVQAERDRLQQVLDALPAGIVIADVAGRFTVANEAVVPIFGAGIPGRPVPRGELEAHEVYGVYRLDGTPYPSAELPLQRALWQGELVRGDQFLTRTPAGREITVLANSAPLRDPEGLIVGAVGVFQDISAIHDLERAREEFLSSAAHDLKTPLTGIRGQAQLAQRRLARLAIPTAETQTIAPALAQIVAGTQRMVDLINELVDVTRLQMGALLELERHPTDLLALVRAVVAQHDAAAPGRFQVQTELAALPGVVDTERLERVVGNLLSNALKYSPSGGKIEVRVTREEGPAGLQAVLAVRDQGVGIPAADLPRVFERFYRAGNVAGQIQGTGIGLASVRQIVQQHGGVVTVESVEGQGATFTVRLPLTAS